MFLLPQICTNVKKFCWRLPCLFLGGALFRLTAIVAKGSGPEVCKNLERVLYGKASWQWVSNTVAVEKSGCRKKWSLLIINPDRPFFPC